MVSLSRTASGHLVDLLIMVRRWVYPSPGGGSGPTMSRCTWLNLATGMAIFYAVVVGCLVTLALLQAAHSLHQATISAARPDKAGGHQPPRGLLSSMREHRDMLKYCPPLGGWHQGAEGPSRGVTQEIDSLVDYHLQQQASVVGQHILCLLAG